MVVGDAMKRQWIALGIVSLILLSGVAVAGAISMLPISKSEEQVGYPTMSASGFKVNAAGETYGVGGGGPNGEDPDLIMVMATNGNVGYVRREELMDTGVGSPDNPDDAVGRMQEMRDQLVCAVREELNQLAPEVNINEIAVEKLLQEVGLVSVKEPTYCEGANSSADSIQERYGVTVEQVRYAYEAAQKQVGGTIPVYDSSGTIVVGEYAIG